MEMEIDPAGSDEHPLAGEIQELVGQQLRVQAGGFVVDAREQHLPAVAIAQPGDEDLAALLFGQQGVYLWFGARCTRIGANGVAGQRQRCAGVYSFVQFRFSRWRVPLSGERPGIALEVGHTVIEVEHRILGIAGDHRFPDSESPLVVMEDAPFLRAECRLVLRRLVPQTGVREDDGVVVAVFSREQPGRGECFAAGIEYVVRGAQPFMQPFHQGEFRVFLFAAGGDDQCAEIQARATQLHCSLGGCLGKG